MDPDRAALPVTSADSHLTPGGAPDASGVLNPTIHYLDAQAHADDVIAFPPGDRVAVGFTPRVDDDWQVAGRLPSALPAGRVSGAVLARSAQGTIWAGLQPASGSPGAMPGNGQGTAPVDAPFGPSIQASSTSAVVAPATTGGAEPAAPVSPSGLRREVFGFVPYWELSASTTTYDWRVLSTVAYFSVGATASGDLLKQNSDGSVTTGWGGWTSAKMTSLITGAHQHGTRVVLTISCFAWTTGQQSTQAALLGSATARTNLARQVAAAVAERGADGVNLDFEPIVSGTPTNSRPSSEASAASSTRSRPGTS